MVEAAIVDALRWHDVQVVTLTGDIVDSASRLPVLQEFCRSLRGAGASVLATLGNWEHWGGVRIDDLARAYSDSSARLLLNETLVLSDGVGVSATDDSTAGDARPGRALNGKGGDARVLLTHSPELLDRVPMSSGPFALGLADHTHGGQVRAGNVVPFVPPGSGRFVAGWYDTPAGRAYVSRGTGTSIAPARFTCRPELPIFRLRQA